MSEIKENSAAIQLTENIITDNDELLFTFKQELHFLMINGDDVQDEEKYDNNEPNGGVINNEGEVSRFNNNQQNQPNIGVINNEEEVSRFNNNQQNKSNIGGINDEDNKADFGRNNDSENNNNSLFNYYHNYGAISNIDQARQDMNYIFHRNVNKYNNTNNGGFNNNNDNQIGEIFGEIGYPQGYKPNDVVLKEIMMRFAAAIIELEKKERQIREGEREKVKRNENRNSRRGQCDNIWD